MHFLVFYLHIKHFWKKKKFRKKNFDVNSDVNFRSDVNFLDVTCSKIPKNAISGKSIKKTSNGVDAPMRWIFRKLCPNENFGSLTSIFDVNFIQNLRNLELSQAKRLSYLLELFCWHILGRFKEIPRNGFSAKSQKLPKMAKK